jgi:hypothetical protein
MAHAVDREAGPDLGLTLSTCVFLCCIANRKMTRHLPIACHLHTRYNLVAWIAEQGSYALEDAMVDFYTYRIQRPVRSGLEIVQVNPSAFAANALTGASVTVKYSVATSDTTKLR